MENSRTAVFKNKSHDSCHTQQWYALSSRLLYFPLSLSCPLFVSPFRELDITAMTPPPARVSRLHFRQHGRPSKCVGVIYPKRYCCLYSRARPLSAPWSIRLPWLTVEERREAERSGEKQEEQYHSTRQVSKFPSTALQNKIAKRLHIKRGRICTS